MISQKFSTKRSLIKDQFKEFNPLNPGLSNHDGTLVFEEQNQSKLCSRIASHQNVLETLPIIWIYTQSLLSNYEYVS